jgi:hypothetical protein
MLNLQPQLRWLNLQQQLLQRLLLSLWKQRLLLLLLLLWQQRGLLTQRRSHLTWIRP